ncbi:hypothetical protein [Streptomyces sp. NPDC056255]|uniref:hypothetical protein n=1 Tax=Streptomyces sp. NPDC056255 TaxID=3345764 RepID=UPI0035E112B9
MVRVGQSSEKAALIYQHSDLDRSRSVACDAFMAEVNGRVHRETRRVPAEMLAEDASG